MSSILQQLQDDTKAAMKARDMPRVQMLRLFVNALQVEAKNKLRDLDESEQIAVLAKQKKQRLEAAEAFTAAGHPERAAEEQQQADILDTYLPAQLTADELNEMVAAAIKEAGASSPKDMGAVMKLLTPKTAGRADGKVVSQAVQAALRSA